MFQFTENQELVMNNLLCVKKWISQSEGEEIVKGMSVLCKEYDATSPGFIVTSTYQISEKPNGVMSETEIMIPLDKSFAVTSPYFFKPNFKLVNALKIECEFSSSKSQLLQKEIQNYILEHKLEPITRAYTLTHTNYDFNKTLVEIYVGINPNIL